MEKMAHFFNSKTSKISRIKFLNFHFSIGQILIVLIIILAAFLRIHRIEDYMTFLGDEGRDVLVVYGILHGDLTLLGPTSSVGGFFLGPIYYYFMTPFLWLFNYNPAGPAVMVALFGVATVFFVYKIGNEFFNFKTGIIAASLYAVSPIVIAYSRSSWNPNLVPFFSLATLYFIYKAAILKSKKRFILSGIFFGVLMQLHYIATFLGAIIVFYVILLGIISGKKIFLKITSIIQNGLYLFLGFIIGWAPFLVFEIRHGFPNLTSIFNFIFNSEDIKGGGNFSSIISDVFFRLFGRLLTRFPPPEQVSLHSSFNIDLWYYSTLILAVFSSFLVFYQFLKILGKKRDESFYKLSLITVWFFLGILIFGFYKKSIYDYYFQFMFPLPFLFVGFALYSLYTNSHELFDKLRVPNLWIVNQIGKLLAVGIFITLFWINLDGRPFKYAPNKQMIQVKEISEVVLEKTGNKPFNFALITGGNSDHAYRYFFKLAKKDPVIINTVEADPERKSVTEQLLVVCEKASCAPLGDSLWEISGFGRAEILGKWDVSVVEVYKLGHYKGD